MSLIAKEKPHLLPLNPSRAAPILAGCESPIEAKLGRFLYDNWCNPNGYSAGLYGWLFPSGTSAELIRLFLDNNLNFEGANFKFGFSPQVVIGSYRVDFLVVGQGMPKSEPMLIAVECDGHDFHEKTKEQAARDKARDRALVGAGYYVMRFTGAEIWRDAEGCCQQILDAIEGYWDRDFDKVFADWERQQGDAP